ncbi:MAG: ubiquinol-cytochrome C chaperone family protein [Alphaproteobacteria bacterium]
MFGSLFKQKYKKVTDEDIAQALYECALNSARNPAFYEEYDVPDSFDGRFDMLLIHIFVILRKVQNEENYEEFSQILFDITFINMDQTLREMGIGDMGIPKHMRRMMTAFNGRMHSYQMAIDPESLKEKDIEGLKKTTLSEALRRNLYGTVDEMELNKDNITKMCKYIRANLERKSDADILEIRRGNAKFYGV